jgi:RimJ/RimL family protein N-acetyltransferase
VPEPYGETDARAYLLTRHDHIHAGTAAPFAIVHASDPGRALGSITLMRLAWEHRRGEVGYWLAREARGHGHTTRAVRLLCAWAFKSLGLERIDLFAAIANVASQRVAERAGFTREALLRFYLRGRDGQLDAVAYGLLVDELNAAGARSAR